METTYPDMNLCCTCKYYIGGNDYGLFCSHKDMYNHIGHPDDEACRRYKTRSTEGKE